MKDIMSMRSSTVALLAIALMSIVFAFVGASSTQQVVASVNVICPFSLTLTPTAPFYVQPQNIVISYNAVLLGSGCSALTSVSGDMYVQNSVTNTVYDVESVAINTVTSTPSTGNVVFNSVLTYNNGAFPQSSDVAELTLSSGTSSNSAFSSVFDVIQPANIIVDSLAANPQSATPGSSIGIDSDLVNNGGLAAINTVVNIAVTAPNSLIYTTNQAVGNISPTSNQIELITISGNVFTSTGTYLIQENASYYSTYSSGNTVYQSNIIYSSNYTTSVSIQNQNSGGGGGGGGSAPVPPPLPPATIAQVSFASMPLFTDIIAGNSTLQQLGLQNTGNTPIWVNLSVPTLSFGTIMLSSNSVYLLPYQTLSIGIFIQTNSNVVLGDYYIPISLSVSRSGTSQVSHGTTYIETSLHSPNPLVPTVTRSILLSNSSQNLTSTVQVYNPTNSTIYDALVTIRIPQSSVPAEDYLSYGGAFSSSTLENGTYVITWKIPSLQPGGSAILYYSINNVLDPQTLTDTPVSLSGYTQQASGTGFRIIDISAPTGYINSSASIRVSGIYTGPNATILTLVLIGPTGLYIDKPTQLVSVVPNGAAEATFQVGPFTSAGTQQFQLTVYGNLKNQTYLVPMIVLQQSQSSPPVPVQGTKTITIYGFYIGVSAIAILGLIVIGAVTWRIRNSLNRARYDSARAQRLMRMRERVSRDEGPEPHEPRGPIGE